MNLASAWISPKIVDQVLEEGRAEGLNEACGVIFPDSMVVKLPNLSPSPHNSFEIAPEDLVNAIEAYVERSGVNPESLSRGHFIIWHTHPSGGVGPSTRDMKSRTEGFINLVVTLPNGEAAQF